MQQIGMIVFHYKTNGYNWFLNPFGYFFFIRLISKHLQNEYQYIKNNLRLKKLYL